MFDFPTKSGDKIKIDQRIGLKCRHLGIFLLNDKSGDIMDEIENKSKFDLKQILPAIFKQWLMGKGASPCIWATLVAVFRMMDLNNLANEIKDNLGNFSFQISSLFYFYPMCEKMYGWFARL